MKNLVCFLIFLTPIMGYSQSIGEKLTDGIGIEFSWQEGSINLRVQDNRFRLYFLDKEGKIMPPNIKNASIRYSKLTRPTHYIYGPFNLSETGERLISARYVHPPFLYWVSVIFFKKEGNKLVNLKTFERSRFSQTELNQTETKN